MNGYPAMRDARLPTTRADIEAFESAHDVVLPASYKRFLLATSGGVPLTDAYPIENHPNGPIGVIQSFKGIGVDLPTEEHSYAYDLYSGGVPDKLLPIAGDGGGSFTCLDLRAGIDRVAYWNHRHYWSTGEWREQDLYHVAPSFEAFLEILRPNPY